MTQSQGIRLSMWGSRFIILKGACSKIFGNWQIWSLFLQIISSMMKKITNIYLICKQFEKTILLFYKIIGNYVFQDFHNVPPHICLQETFYYFLLAFSAKERNKQRY